jgi:inner membrane protein
MASIGHVAIGMAAARLRGLGGRSRGGWAAAMAGWSALSLAPDLDVVGFAFGVRYGDAWGHRGATHSLTAALALGAVAGLIAARGQATGHARGGWRTGLFVALVLASHGLLDALTDGGRGIALLWPFSLGRFFAPWRPIPVAPIGLGFLSARGLRVALVELVLFAPVFLYALWPRRSAAPPEAAPPSPPRSP